MFEKEPSRSQDGAACFAHGVHVGMLIDTSILIALEWGMADAEELIHGREQEPFGISLVTATELVIKGLITMARQVGRS